MQLRFTKSLTTVSLQVQAASRVVASPRAGLLSFAASRVFSPAPTTLTFTSRFSTGTMADSNANANAHKRPRASNNRRNAQPKKARSAEATSSFSTTPQVLSERKFTELEGQIHPNLLKAITHDLKFDKMTPVQAQTTGLLSNERPDALVQARTGTGKTLAFLLPAIQTCIKDGYTNGSVSALIIAPTRELAMQIATEAKTLMKPFPNHRVEVVMGSTNKDKEERRILEKADILIATPGRLMDHMNNETVMRIFKHVRTLVLDEADRLLDMGFRKDIQTIVEKIPRSKVAPIQGMLFSATVPPHVHELAGTVCSGKPLAISTIPEGEVQTHERVQQDLIEVSEFSDVGPALLGCIKEEAARKDLSGPLKAIVFAPTSQQVDYYERMLATIPGLPPISALHSKKSQNRRTKTTQEFRTAKGAILVATDVVARGMDFPGVTTVIQAGLPDMKENYIHRLGRTARAEAEGRGILIAARGEKFYLDSKFKDLKFTPRQANTESSNAVNKANQAMTWDEYERLYRSWVAFHAKSLKNLRWTQKELFQEANAFISALGANRTPTMTKKAVRMIGLKLDTPGLEVEKVTPARAPRGQPKGGRPAHAA